MQEFASISVSSYEAGSLAEQLTERSRDGWSVVAIVPTGSTVTAYLGRDTDGASASAARETAPEPAPQPTAEPASEPAPGAVVPDASPGWAAGVAATASEPAPASDPTASTATADTATASTTTADTASADSATTTESGSGAAGAAPAGWYADPSGRFELRYWDGGQWTEHVSRAGQQYTDPPVA